MATPPDWSIAKAIAHYNIESWGLGFFDVNEKGHLSVHPYGKQGPTIDVMDVVEDIREKNLGLPFKIFYVQEWFSLMKHF